MKCSECGNHPGRNPLCCSVTGSQQLHRVHRGWAMAVEATGRDELMPEPAELQHQQSNDSNAVKAHALRVARCCKPRDEIHGMLHTSGEIRIRCVTSITTTVQ